MPTPSRHADELAPCCTLIRATARRYRPFEVRRGEVDTSFVKDLQS